MDWEEILCMVFRAMSLICLAIIFVPIFAVIGTCFMFLRKNRLGLISHLKRCVEEGNCPLSDDAFHRRQERTAWPLIKIGGELGTIPAMMFLSASSAIAWCWEFSSSLESH